MKAITCCRYCEPPKRYPGCKDHCDQYQQQKKAKEDEADMIWERRKEDRQFYGYEVAKKNKRLHNESRKPKKGRRR
jgi:hypothetical protein